MNEKITTKTGQEMLDTVLPLYNKDDYSLSIFEANGKVMDEVRVAVEQTRDQMYPQKATWSLGYWEEMLGIKIKKNLTDLERVQKVLFELNKYFPITRNRLEQIVNVHVQNKDARVIEDRGEYSFTIQIPSENLVITADIHRDVEEAKPAHLAYLISVLIREIAAIITPKEYAFSVPYPITGTFTTTSIHGVASKATPTIEAKEYTFQVSYPITGTFYCVEED